MALRATNLSESFFGPGAVIPVKPGAFVQMLHGLQPASMASSANLIHYWNEDDLVPNNPFPWLDWAIKKVTDRTWD